MSSGGPRRLGKRRNGKDFMSTTSPPAIETTDLVKTFGSTRALDEPVWR